MRIILLAFFFVPQILFSQEVATPLEKNNFQIITSYNEITDFVKELGKRSEFVTIDSIGKSIEGRNLYAIKFSSGVFGKDKSKVKLLFFAQQHGNEQSGKEGSLLLAKELLKPENRYLLSRLDIAIVPQMNPDGSELNKRRNGNKVDLNRTHLILTEPELIALHNFFDRYLFEVTMDIHEYFPYRYESEVFTYRRNVDEQVGINTNINISKEIRDLSKKDFLPFISKYFADKQFTYFEYSLSGLSDDSYLRYSTFDIDDGRQSFGIQNTLSFIQEGLNGKDYFIDNIKRRTEGQMTGMRGLIEFAYQNQSKIKKLVASERKKLTNKNTKENISIQFIHAQDGSKLFLPVFSYLTNTDTVIEIKDYRPGVKSLVEVTKPLGYLIPKNQKNITDWAQRHNLSISSLKGLKRYQIERYHIKSIDSVDFEGNKIASPMLEASIIQGGISIDDYIYIPTNQLKCNLIVLALEPKSMLGLVNYTDFNYLLKPNEYFPIFRVIGN